MNKGGGGAIVHSQFSTNIEVINTETLLRYYCFLFYLH